MLRIENLSAGYGSFLAVQDVSIHIEEHETIAIIGPNGAGKSSLVKAIIGLISPQKGNIIFQDQDITGWDTYQIIRTGIALIPERRRLFPRMSVQENLELGAYLVTNKEEKKKRMEEIFETFPILGERKTQLARTLSGGEQQMLALGRGLMMDPKLIIVDESSVGLAPIIIKGVCEKINQLSKEGKTILMIEQNVGAALSCASRLYVMQNAKMIYEDTPEGIVNNKEIADAYLRID
jgi:branched-chain amino acid transport system ATP-binding protein